jgi:hypothetical protein
VLTPPINPHSHYLGSDWQHNCAVRRNASHFVIFRGESMEDTLGTQCQASTASWPSDCLAVGPMRRVVENAWVDNLKVTFARCNRLEADNEG